VLRLVARIARCLSVMLIEMFCPAGNLVSEVMESVVDTPGFRLKAQGWDQSVCGTGSMRDMREAGADAEMLTHTVVVTALAFGTGSGPPHSTSAHSSSISISCAANAVRRSSSIVGSSKAIASMWSTDVTWPPTTLTLV